MPTTATSMKAAELVKAISVCPTLATGKRSIIRNWWIGSAAMALVVQKTFADDSGRAHHVKDPGGEAEQQKHNQPPRRNSQPAVEQPADQCAYDHARHQLGRKPQTAGERRSIGGLTRTGN